MKCGLDMFRESILMENVIPAFKSERKREVELVITAGDTQSSSSPAVQF